MSELLNSTQVYGIIDIHSDLPRRQFAAEKFEPHSRGLSVKAVEEALGEEARRSDESIKNSRAQASTKNPHWHSNQPDSRGREANMPAAGLFCIVMAEQNKYDRKHSDKDVMHWDMFKGVKLWFYRENLTLRFDFAHYELTQAQTSKRSLGRVQASCSTLKVRGTRFSPWWSTKY